jgi:chromosome segregation ATPase
MEEKLAATAGEAETKLKTTEASISDGIKKRVTEQGEKILADMDRLKTEAASFQEGIQRTIQEADVSQKQFGDQLSAMQEDLDRQLASLASEAESNRKAAEASIAEDIRKNVAEQGEKVLADMEQFKAEALEFQRGVAEKMGEADSARKQLGDRLMQNMESSLGNFRTGIEKWQAQHTEHMKEIDGSIEDIRRRNNELAEENDEQIASARNLIGEVRREMDDQEKLFEHTSLLKAELDRYIENLDGDISKIDQLKNEIGRFENQLAQIKRTEDEVNAKLTRFLAEKHRIEVMENDFNRLLQTSQSVEEKLTHVSNSDDILQAMQVKLRHLEDAIKETEEKYQRVERKSKTLQETNDSIDRNFKNLQEGELTAKRIEDLIALLKIDMDAIQTSVHTLTAENEKAREAAEKLATLDESVKWLEKRIAEMNSARESLTRLATELKTLDKDAQNQLKLTRSMLDREAGKLSGQANKPSDKGAPPPRNRENIIRLRQQGWSVDEIAQTYGIAKGEVELILELASKDV